MARCTIAAATAESTPPDSAQMARPRLADLLADPLDLLVDDVDHRPGLAAAGDLVQEVLEHLLAVLGVQHLGVPLDPGEAAPGVLEGGDRGDRRRGEDGEALGRRGHRVAVRHPDVVGDREVGEQRAALGDGDRRPAVLAGAGVGDLPAEAAGHQLEAVAHAEDGHPGREDGVVDAGGVVGVDRGRPAAEDDRLRPRARASPRPAWSAARSRSRPAPPARGGRSAGRTARRSRRRGPGRGQGWRSPPKGTDSATPSGRDSGPRPGSDGGASDVTQGPDRGGRMVGALMARGPAGQCRD